MCLKERIWIYAGETQSTSYAYNNIQKLNLTVCMTTSSHFLILIPKRWGGQKDFVFILFSTLKILIDWQSIDHKYQVNV